MKISAEKKAGTKPTPIVPQVWGNVWRIDVRHTKPGEGLVEIGPDEYLSPERYPTEEMAEAKAEEAMNHCFTCVLRFWLGHVVYVGPMRLE